MIKTFVMKSFSNATVLLLILSTLFSCNKDKIPSLSTKKSPEHVYYVSFYDHKTGEKVTGLEAELISIHNFEGFIIGSGTIKTDVNGNFSFSPYKDFDFINYLKISNQSYVEASYEINEYPDITRVPIHTREGSNGPNVVYAKLLRKDGNNFFFAADLYRKAAVDVHIRQVSNFSDTVNLNFNASVIGTDLSNPANNFGINELFGNGLQLSPGKKIDTTVRVYAFGDYLNSVSWMVYENVFISLDQQSRRPISEGKLEEKIFSSDTLSDITITF